MRASVYALPRLRRRHWKPPDQWIVLWFVLMADGLGFIAFTTIRVLEGHVLDGVGLVIWTFAFTQYRKSWYRARRVAQKNDEAAPAPPAAISWLVAVAITAVLVFDWIVLLAG